MCSTRPQILNHRLWAGSYKGKDYETGWPELFGWSGLGPRDPTHKEPLPRVTGEPGTSQGSTEGMGTTPVSPPSGDGDKGLTKPLSH